MATVGFAGALVSDLKYVRTVRLTSLMLKSRRLMAVVENDA